MRISNLLMAMIVLLVSADALALGLGGLRTQSSLNSPFYGEIDLIGVNRDELDTVTARLASDEEFEKAGIDRPHFLTRLRFQAMVGTSGRPIVQVTSREPIREPYMDFLVEVIWAEGTLVKEYAVLLDPPGTTGRPAPTIAAPVATAQSMEAEGGPAISPSPSQAQPASGSDRRSTPAAAAAPSRSPSAASGDELVARASDAALVDTGAGAETTPSRESETPSAPQGPPSETADSGAPATTSGPPPARGQPPESAASSALRSPPPAPATVASASSGPAQYPLRYGPVQRGDGLVRVARKVAPSGATVEQTAMALYRNNQHAFIGGDINKLIVGPTMVIPSKEELFALDPDEAKREFERALAGGEVRTAPIAAVPEPDIELATETVESARLKIVGSPEAKTPDTADEAPAIDEGVGAVGTEERVSESSPLNVAARQVAGLQEDLLLVRETSAANREETRELQERIAGLEQQLEDIKRLLEVQAEIARLQLEGTRSQMLPSQAGGAEVSGASSQSVTATADTPGLTPQEPSELSTAPEADDLATVSPSSDGKPQASSDAADDRSTAAQGLVASVLNEIPLTPVLIGGALLVAGGLGTIAWSRRRRFESTSPDDDLLDESEAAEPLPPGPSQANLAGTEKPPANAPPSAPAGQSAAPAAAASESRAPAPAPVVTEPAQRALGSESAQLASEVPGPVPTAESGVGSDVLPGQAETQDADVITEADIYMLYGRYREAESLLRDELRGAPDRVDVKYKLAEVYAAGENREALASLVEQMRAAGEDGYEPARWEEILQAHEGMPDSEPAGPPRLSPNAPRNRQATESVEPPAEAPRPRDTDALSGSVLGLAGEVDSASVDSESAVEPSDRYRSRAEAVEEMELELDDSGQLRSIGEELSLHDRQAADSQVDLDQGAAEADELDLELEGLEGIEDLLETGRGASVFDDGKERGQTPAPNQLDKPTSGELAGNGLDDELELDLADPLAASRSDGSAPPSVTYPTPGLALEPERARGAVDDPFADLDDDDLGGDLAPTEMGHEAGSSNDVASPQWQADSVLWDEAGTKLDLARAYIDMDDVDAARAILDEVVMEGTDEQRVAARAMLKELG